jgi:ribonuclease R
LGREYFHFDPEANTLMGSDTGILIGIGQRVTVRLTEAVPVTGGIALELLTLDGKALPQGGRGGRGPAGRTNPKRKGVKAKRKADKVKRKVKRTRR